MQKILLTAGFMLCALFANAQIGISKTFDLKDPADLLSMLFDTDTFSVNKEALWEPLTYADELSANLSDDGWMHTRFDTLLYYSSYEIERAVAVFETLHYERGAVSD